MSHVKLDVRHHRNYLTQDIIRRILRDYFGYEVNFVMNVTDVEDKVR
jgi:cysteinyl-tRNA synthetase